MELAVVKCGGAAIARGRFDLGRWIRPGERAVVVHGAGPRITAALQAAGVESCFVGGRRVTTPEAIPLVREALRLENAEICRQVGPRAVPLMGDDLGLEADPVDGLGLVGRPRPVAPATLRHLVEANRIPVVAPLAQGPLNVNADDAACALAVALGASRLVFVSDVDGVLIGGAPAERLEPQDLEAHRTELGGGMLPKLEAALEAARAGVQVRVGATRIVV